MNFDVYIKTEDILSFLLNVFEVIALIFRISKQMLSLSSYILQDQFIFRVKNNVRDYYY